MDKRPTPDGIAHLAGHQLSFVEAVAAAPAPRRFILSAPPGTGKSATLLVTIARLVGLGEAHSGRSLLIAPAPLLAPYAHRAASYGLVSRMVDPQVYRRMQVEGEGGSNLWHAPGLYVVSPQFLQRGSRLDEVLAASWDVVAIDAEAWGTGQSWLSKALRTFWISPSVTTALAVSSRADPDVFSDFSNTNVVRWDYPRLFAARVLPIEPVDVSLSASEEEFARLLVATAHAFLEGSAAEVAFARALLKAWGSSLYEVEQTLRRAMIPADESHFFAETGVDSPHDESRDAWSSTEPGEIRRSEVAKLLEKFDAIEGDSKWERCAAIISQAVASATREARVVIFTEAIGTARYVAELSRESGYAVQLYSRSSEVEENEMLAREADAGPTVIVANTLAVQGLEFAANCVVHYDLPTDVRVFWYRRTRLRTESRECLLVDPFVTTRTALERMEQHTRELFSVEHE